MNTSAGIDLPPVVVAGGFQTGVVLMRDLKRHGLETWCVDYNPEQPCFKTVYGKARLCPNPDTHPAEWERFMVDLAAEIGRRPVIIPSADQFVSAIASHSAALSPHYIFRAASVATQALLATKERQYEIADDNGLSVPKTRFVQSLEAVKQFASEARFPCLIKPVHFREWERFPVGHPLLNQKTAQANSPDELESVYRLVAGVTPEVVIQEIVEGPDDGKLCFLGCYGKGGKRLGSCVVRLMRTTPIYFGSASIVRPVDDPEAHDLSDAFFRKLGYEGLCELELKRDSRDGQVKLIEANPRYSVTFDAAPYAGIDMGWLHYLDLIGEPVEPLKWNGKHFHHIVLKRDVACFRDYLKAGLITWGEFLKTYRSAVFFDFDLRDRRVAKDTVVYVLKALLYPYYRRLFPKKSS